MELKLLFDELGDENDEHEHADYTAWLKSYAQKKRSGKCFSYSEGLRAKPSISG